MGLLDYLRRAVPKKADAEALLALASGAVAEPAAGLAGLYGLATGGLDKGASNIERTREALTYHPRDTSSLEALARVTDPVLGRIERGKQYLGDATFDATGSPALATAARVAPDALLTLLGARTAGIKGPTLREIAENSAAHYPMGSPGAQIGAIRAYHGSPHDFDRFSMDHIGTGEGAQAYGHGLYFAGNKELAEFYRNKLAADHSRLTGVGEQLAAKALASENYDTQAAIDRLVRGKDVVGGPVSLEKARQYVESAQAKITRGNGNLYEAELAPDEADLLDYDKPIGKQPEKVRDAIRTLAHEVYDVNTDPGLVDQWLGNGVGPKASEFYERLGRMMQFDRKAQNGTKAASEALLAAGIPGLRYLDAGSRAAGDGSRNYVMFDDNLIKILRKNGAPNP